MKGPDDEAPVLSAYRRGDWQPSLDTAPLPGATRARLALVPHIVAHSDRRWWDGIRADLPPLSGRRELVLSALELFRHGTVTIGGIGPQSADAFRAALWESAGLPGPLVEQLADFDETVKEATQEVSARYDAPVEIEAIARRIRTGQVEINGAAFNPLAPFGGYKQSGTGRELGRHGLEEFLQVKALQR